MEPFKLAPDSVFNSQRSTCAQYKEIHGNCERKPYIQLQASKTKPNISDEDDDVSVRNDTISINDIHGRDVFGYDVEGYDIAGYSRDGEYKSSVYKIESHENLREHTDDSSIEAKVNTQSISEKCLYIRTFLDLQKQLRKCTLSMLMKIKRICERQSNIPNQWIKYYWLFRHQQVNLLKEISNDIQNRLKQNLTVPPEMSTESTSSNNEMDKRFCFESKHLRNSHITHPDCPDEACIDAICPNQPRAKCKVIKQHGECQATWYNETNARKVVNCTKQCSLDNYRSEDSKGFPCHYCTCTDGVVECVKRRCPTPRCEYPARLPAQCCLTCYSCEYNDTIYGHGDEIKVPDRPCDFCRCNAGNLYCIPQPCPRCQSQAASSPKTSSLKCCPNCADCNGHKNGTTWYASPCKTCTCLNGVEKCKKKICPNPLCSHPAKNKHKCCPECLGCSLQQKIFRNREKFLKHNSPCDVCLCSQGNITCERRTCPRGKCQHPAVPRGRCCPQCRDCYYEGRFYKNGSEFAHPVDVCKRCRCKSGSVRCKLDCQPQE
ncbi:unnamed protein product [Owenia fusiformis]|uniref:Uncharacterized protein n=1 Tax=Owenia fusiformis TaxID=6347 RepID=A0A8J1XK51_OWEFU|nr:unnamed protein product [Owenia fusiformis]